jgi:FkbM family methyltransferase
MKSESFLYRASNFAQKPAQEKRLTVRYFTRLALSKFPYAPFRVRLPLPSGGAAFFWWSYVDFMFQPDRALRDYWGQDIGELRFLWNFLRPGMVVFDIGAHHGVYAVLAAKRVGARGRVVAFEPSPVECRRLRLHLWMNRISSVKVESVALSSTTGQAEFFRVLEGYKGRSGLRFPRFPDRPSPVQAMQVSVTTLDEYINQQHFERVDLMKIDAEGAELEILRGSSRLLSTVRPIALCEVWDYVTGPWGHRARDVACYLQGLGYHWFEFRPDGTLFFHKLQDSYDEVKNYLAVPEEKLPIVLNWVSPE